MSKWQPFFKILRRRLIFAGVLIAACFVFTQWILPMVHTPSASVVLNEAHQRQLLKLRKNFQSGSVYSLKMHVHGHLNGTAMLRLFDSVDISKVHREERIGSGGVDTQIMNDWYTDDCRLEYEPLSATQGTLKIDYQFKTLKKK